MAKRFRLLTRPAVTLALIALAAGYNAAHARSVLPGGWAASVIQGKSETSDKSDVLNLTVERLCPTEPLLTNDGVVTPFVKPIEKYPFCSTGQSFLGWHIEGGVGTRRRFYDFSELRGLTREQALAGGAVKFSLVREAGTIEFEGSFQNGRGSGTVRFTGNQSFAASMRSRGFDFEQGLRASDGDLSDLEDRLFAAAAIGITTALADDLLSADFGRLDVHGLFRAASFRVDSKFKREMKESGFPDLSLRKLVKARLYKVTPEFVAGVRNEGLNDLSVEDFVKLRMYGIDADFIRRAKADGVPPEVEELMKWLAVKRKR
ncbi:MAG TPA: hypothetical protein VKB12_04765 [Pyrinomonadaceae bacterium]|nr:hypothetical protein [Pyrinomonadaceae bacterium]